MRRCLITLLCLASLAACTRASSPSPPAASAGANPTAGAPTGSPGATPDPASGPGPGHSASPGTTLPAPPLPPGAPDLRAIRTWAYQLQNYPGGKLDELAKSPAQLVVIDLARDAKTDNFRPEDLAVLHRTGKRVLAYFEIGSIENFRPEYPGVKDLVLNRWEDWPEEFFVKYWEQSWWDKVVRPRLDAAMRAGFDGVYLDTPLAYEEIDLKLVPAETRESLGRKMADLIARIRQYTQKKILIFPQNSPELLKYPGYVDSIDGIGMEELFFLATDRACTESFCAENLAATRTLRDAGKLVLAVDYATSAANVRTACDRYRQERFAGYVTIRDLNTVKGSCS